MITQGQFRNLEFLRVGFGLVPEAKDVEPGTAVLRRRYSSFLLSTQRHSGPLGGPRSMDLDVGVTDGDWDELLAGQPSLDDVNFWQPAGNRVFRRGELFLFKLHAPRHFIVGGGVFVRANIFPVSFAWGSFGEANGATTLAEMRRRPSSVPTS